MPAALSPFIRRKSYNQSIVHSFTLVQSFTPAQETEMSPAALIFTFPARKCQREAESPVGTIAMRLVATASTCGMSVHEDM